MNRRFALSSLIAATATAITAPVAFGASEWCEDDPLVVIRTPTGKKMPLHVTNYAEGAEYSKFLALVPRNQKFANAWINWSVALARKGGQKPSGASATAVQWDVTIRVTIHTTPGDGLRFRTRTVASSLEYAKGTIYDEAVGQANREMEMSFSMWA